MQNANYDLSFLNFILPLTLKSLDFRPEYVRNPSGIITSSTNNGVLTWGEGNTYEESRADLISTLRTWAELYFEDFSTWFKSNPEEYPYMLKIMLSNDEELAQCLSGETIKDF